MKERNIISGSSNTYQHDYQNQPNSSSKVKSSFNSMFKFSNNFRVSIALVPLLLLLLYIGGKNTIYIASFTVFLVYISEYLKYQSISLGIIWVGLFISYLSILFEGMILVQHSIINLILLLNIGLSMGLIGIWIIIQFSWFTQKFSTASTLLERLLFSNTIYPTSILFTWATIVINGIDSAPFYLLGYLFILFFLFGLPQKSFKIRSSKQINSTHDFILGRLDSMLMTIVVLFFPSTFYFSIYHNVFFNSFDHVINIMLLMSLSSVFVFVLSKYGSLWWLLPNYWNQRLGIQKYSNTSAASGNVNQDYNLQQQLKREKEGKSNLNSSYSLVFSIGKIFKILSMAVLVGCIEYRVIFNSPTFYTIVNHLSPKFGLLVVTIALYSFSAIFYFIFMGMESNFSTTTSNIPSYYQYIISLIACAFSIAISILLSSPIYIYPFAILSSYSIINYLFKKKSNSYLIFIISTSIFLIWFLNRNYFFIEYYFINSYPVSNLSIQMICCFIFLLFVLSLLMLTSISSPVFPLVSILQSIVLTFLEVSLHSTNSTIYPTYFIVLSSLLIIYINSRLLEKKLLSNNIIMVSNSLMISKVIGLIFTPLNENILACFMFTLLFYINYQPESKESNSILSSATWNLNKLSSNKNNTPTSSSTPSVLQTSNKQKVQLYTLIGFSAIVSFIFNNQITLPVLNLFLNLNLDTVTNIVKLSSFLLTFGVSIIPICFRSSSPLKYLRSLNIFVLLLSMLILLFNPTIEQSTTTTTTNSSNNLLWTNWLLLGTVLIIIIGIGLRVSISKSTKLKILFSILFGSSIGIYICLNYFLKIQQVGYRSDYYYKKIIGNNSNKSEIGDDFIDLILNLSFSVMFSLMSFFFIVIKYPSNRSSTTTTASSSYMFTLYALILVNFGINYYLLAIKYSTSRNQNILETTRLSLFGLYVGLGLLLSIYLKFHIKSIITMEANSGGGKSQYNYYQSPIKKDTGGGKSMMNSSGTPKNKLFLNINSWVFKVGNISCISSYLVSIYIGYSMNFSERAVFILSPILLLLFTERGWFKFLAETHRYLPMVLSLSAFLLCNSFFALLTHGKIQPSEWAMLFGLSPSLIKMWWVFKNWLLFLFTLPSIYFTIKNLLKQVITQKQLFSDSTLFILIPSTILSALFSDITSIKLLSLIGLIGIFYNIKNKLLFNNINNNINSL